MDGRAGAMTAAPAPAPMVARPSAQGRRPALDWLSRLLAWDVVVLAAMLGIAAAARWPNLWLIPTFTDETIEVKLSYDIVRGAAAPLTSVDPYIGAFWNWVLALGFWTVGLSPWLPRLLVFLTGVATVGAAWWLGREVTGRRGAVVTALFMAGCSTHVLVNSHVAWSHSTTPLWTTLGMACLVRALRGDLRWAVGTGFFVGLGVQTHITSVLLLPGIGLTVLLQRPGILRTRWALFAVLAFALATVNLLVYNVQTGGGTLRGGQAVLADYNSQDDGPDASAYTENLGRLTLATSWVLSGAIEKRRFVNETLAQPLLLGYLGLAVASVLWAARRRVWLPLLVCVPYLLALPLLQGKYEPLLNGRYVMPILPLAFASIGLVVAELSIRLARRWPTQAGLTGAVMLGVALVVALYPLAPLARYQRSARTNHPILAAHEAVLAGRQPGEKVLVDYGLDGVFFMAAGSAFKATELLLGGSNVPYTVIDARPASLEDALQGQGSRLIVLNAEKVRNLSRNFTLTPLMGGERDGPGFGVFRVSVR
ncbi:MAG: glycosyltransferase family 39 protein [Chloroflexi bacterium]|nr:glycosyltransferase family 39 protein [Chloroflexota bacterium]